MIGLIQRVKHARVEVDKDITGQIDTGILLFLGVEKDDTTDKMKRLADKVLNYRIFEDDNGKMNLNLQQVKGELLVVSQFTLVADTMKGNRPSFSSGASPEHGKAMYDAFISYIRNMGVKCETGRFGADMQVFLQNDGPVTFHLNM
ncbi:D-aminoacyl-tRNA deacylase [Aestuariibacter sp. AA17]|uniref:D-aminoacyl-tRNA deacylase n=1 Tax=Fluctibacter corallii TaxID=2984329 RepID=A0ABT3A6H9_9ALTE|nr:D-aminoacyl-tRNA deacylase [Aestuariibacter sp. AA17]MCV2884295.1 D-aminoacyl-tRNA deacylase [Aestuariibacter sp. AA17]